MEKEIDICKMYENKMSISDVSKKTKLSKSMVYRILKRNNINTKRNSSDFIEKLYDYNIDNTFFEKINTEEKAYVLGFLYADGSLNKNGYNVSLKLQERDKSILNKINKAIGSNKPLYFHKKIKKNHQNQYSIVISNKKMYNDLLKTGLHPNKTYDLKFKKVFKNSLFQHFLRGYFDGDGWVTLYKRNSKYISKKTGKISFDRKMVAEVGFTGTNFMCDFLKKYFTDIHINSYLQRDNRHNDKINNLRIKNKEGIVKFYHFIYDNANIFLNRKKNKFLKFLNGK